MNRSAHRKAFFGIALFALAGLAGCTVKTNPDGSVTIGTATKYKGTAVDKTAAWASGGAVSIENDNGEISLAADGQPGTIAVTFRPFAFAGSDEEDSAISRMKNDLTAVVSPGENGSTLIHGQQSGSGSYGYDLVVHLPAGFDAPIAIRQHNGPVSISSVGAASQTKVESDNGSIDTAALPASVYLRTENGSVTASGLPTGQGNVVHSDNGSVAFTLQAGANLTITASSSGGDVTIPEPTPAGWTVTGASPQATIQVGDASGTLQVSSGNGDVDLFAE